MKQTILVILALAACGKQQADPVRVETGARESSNLPRDRKQQLEKEKKARVEGPVDPENGDFTLEEATAGLEGSGKKLMAEFQTDAGTITCELFPQVKETVANFVGLARGVRPWFDPEKNEWVKEPFYDGLAFHRVMPEFMIQSGDPLSRNKYDDPYVGGYGPGYGIADEILPDLKFDKPGRLAMAVVKPHTRTGGSQFFITEVPYPSLDGDYAVFGQCDGIDIVKKISRVRIDDPEHAKPLEPTRLKVRIYRK